MIRHVLAALTIVICGACSKPVEPFEMDAQTILSAQAQQCGKDTDCKGDRVCDSGQCSNPDAVQISTPDKTVENAQDSTALIAGTLRNAPPKFKDYLSGPVFTGPTAKLVLNNELASDYRTRLSEALPGKPTFAGEYVVASWGCGTNCVITAFVNKRTGKTLEMTFGGESGPYLTDFRIDSDLVVAEGYDSLEEVLHGEESNGVSSYVAYFYLLENDELKLIRKIPAVPSHDSDADGWPDGLWRP